MIVVVVVVVVVVAAAVVYRSGNMVFMDIIIAINAITYVINQPLISLFHVNGSNWNWIKTEQQVMNINFYNIKSRKKNNNLMIN